MTQYTEQVHRNLVLQGGRTLHSDSRGWLSYPSTDFSKFPKDLFCFLFLP